MLYDVIVIGAGGVGSCATWQLANRGARVLAIDRFFPPHDRGSSHGRTRIIRKAYFEHPDYVPLLLSAYDLWRDLERESGQTLLHQTGLLQCGPRDGIVVPGVRESGRRWNLDVEECTADEAMLRFPGLVVPPEMDVVFESDAGYLEPERCVAAASVVARRSGASLLGGDPVVRWSVDGSGFKVQTIQTTYVATKLVVAGGAWAAGLMGDVAGRLTVIRKTLHWFDVKPGAYRANDGFPCFLADCPTGMYYGFPVIDDWGLKAAEHTGGESVSDPNNLDRTERPDDAIPVARFLQQFLPNVAASRRHFAACMYTMSPDGNFIVDRHPEHPNLVFAAGLSGHGFKFASVLGQALAQLALDGSTCHSIGFLSALRFRNPDSRSAD